MYGSAKNQWLQHSGRNKYKHKHVHLFLFLFLFVKLVHYLVYHIKFVLRFISVFFFLNTIHVNGCLGGASARTAPGAVNDACLGWNRTAG